MQDGGTGPDAVVAVCFVQLLKEHLSDRDAGVCAGIFAEFFGAVGGGDIESGFQKVSGVSAGAAAEVQDGFPGQQGDEFVLIGFEVYRYGGFDE